METVFKAILKVFVSFFTSLFNLLNELASAVEVFRLGFMVGVIALCFYPDFSSLTTMSYVMGVFLAIALIAHITRRYALFNYINMQKLVDEAMKGNIAAAIVFASVTSVLVTCIVIASHFFTRT